MNNVRVSFEEGFNGQAEVRQESSYYAFGMQHAPISKPGNPNTSLFNGGSEWIADFDPDLYNTFFRDYDPVLGRFNGIDPMSVKYSDFSVYQFVFNNPVSFSDPTGADALADIEKFLRQFFEDSGGGGKVPNGGSWSASSGGYNFSSQNEAFAAGAGYNDIFSSWQNTIYGVRPSESSVMNSSGFIMPGITLRQVNIVADRKRVIGDFNKGGVVQAGFGNELGQVMNLGGVVWGAAELGLQAIRQNNGPQAIGRFLGFGTQRTAKALRSTLGHVTKLGKKLGTLGYVLSVGSYLADLGDKEKVSTATHVNFGISTVLYGAAFFTAGTAAAPFVAGGALIYGAGQVGSWLYNGKTLEENFLK
nr:RHS repeat-associated core domain-containing protein [Pedobacter polysacchareus]